MNKLSRQAHRTTQVRKTLACAGWVVLAGVVQAQTIYRAVGPDGKVTFSDKPPASATNVTATGTGTGGKPLDIGGPVLSSELRQVIGKYPVTLYTSSSCAPCGTGRALLIGRGIPFTEKTVTTNDDAQALQRISGEASLPLLSIGAQHIKGYSDAEWTQFLDAAGYPKTSILPATYRNPVATPLVEVQKLPTPVKSEAEQRDRAVARPPAAAPVDSTANPAGIKF